MSNLELPTSIVTRLVKDATSDQLATLISKDVKKAFSQMAGYYALYLYSISNDIAKESRRKKVTEQDVYQALKETGFEKHIEQLKDFMANYNADKEDQPPAKTTYKKRTNADLSKGSVLVGQQPGEGDAEMDEEEEVIEQMVIEQGNHKRLRNVSEDEEVVDLDDEDLEIVDIKQTK